MTWSPSRLYSQNHEDLYLWRIFKGVDKGFYVDVGAFSPTIDSVTRIFYDQGWSGINFEPHPDLFGDFTEYRDRDLNLQLAVSSAAKKVIFQMANNPGCSQVLREESCDSISSDQMKKSCLLEVQAVTLCDTILSSAPNSVQFLKIDVEGYESEVLEGLRLDRLPPYLHPVVIVVESTAPRTPINIFKGCACEQLYLLDNGYREFFFDGLNTYYCKEAERERFNSYCLPPNVFDQDLVCTPGYFHNLRNDQCRLNAEVDLLQSRLSQLLSSSDDVSRSMNFKISFLEAQLSDCHEQIEKVATENMQMRNTNAQLNVELSKERENSSRNLSKLAWYRAVFPLLVSYLSKSNLYCHRLMRASAQIMRM